MEPKVDPYQFLRERAMKVADEREDHRYERDVALVDELLQERNQLLLEKRWMTESLQLRLESSYATI